MVILLFIICLIASTFGSVVGAGGGFIIKPVLDMIGVIPVETVSFYSSATVLGMAICYLVRSRKDKVRLQIRTSTPLALGAVAGGLIGKFLLEMVINFGGEKGSDILGGIQAILLMVITFFIYLYICNKEKIVSMKVDNLIIAFVIGVVLGAISSFFGIGGGTSNVAVLFFFFSMDTKEAAKNSIYIIVFSQISSIFVCILTGSVPKFNWIELIAMVMGGILGASIGASITKKIKINQVENILKKLLLVIIAINTYNAFKFFLGYL